MKKWIAILLFSCALAAANTAAKPYAIPYKDEGFAASKLLNKSAFDSQKLNISHSYTMSYTSSGYGSHSSGVYLSTVSYMLTPSMQLSFDIGLHNMFHQSGYSSTPMFQQDNQMAPQFILPRISLDYQVTDKVHMSVELINGNDYYKAYGAGRGFYDPFYRNRSFFRNDPFYRN